MDGSDGGILVLLILKSLITAISQSSASLALVALNRGRGTQLQMLQGMALYVREGFRSFRQSKLKYFRNESCVFCICFRINNFYVYAFYRNPEHDGSLYDCLLDSMAQVQSVDDKAVFVFIGEANAHHSEWLDRPTDRHERDALDFFNLSGCEQLVRCPTHSAGNRLDLVMSDAPDLVDVFIGIPLRTPDHCFISCVLQVEHSVPEYNIRSTVILRHRTNWDNIRCAVRSYSWSTILWSVDSINAFDRAIGEVIGTLVPTTV